MIRDRFTFVSLHIYGTSVLAARLDRRDVRVDQNDLDALLLEGLDGLGTCVARLARRGDGVLTTA